MPGDSDGDVFYSPLKIVVYEILFLLLHKVNAAIDALAAYLRSEVKVFQRLFSCTCQSTNTGK
jgi:hypothetical protein